jgi:signal transduction histidine kinase
MTENLMSEVRTALSAIDASGDTGLVEPLLAELWEARNHDAPPGSVRLSAIEPFALTLVGRGIQGSRAVRLVLSAGRALVEQAEHDGQLDGAGARRLGALVDEAAARAAQAVEQQRRVKRQQWISYLVHELKNPLNTVLNALWLLREKGSDPKQAARFLELAERAVKRLEGRCRDVRELDESLVTPPPGWEPPAKHS